MKLLIGCLVSFAVTYLLIPVVIVVAKKFKCLDIPGIRRFHSAVTPKWGGAAFFAGVLTSVPFAISRDDISSSYVTASCLLVALGVLDDYRCLGWKAKFGGITAAAAVVIHGGQTIVHQLGSATDGSGFALGGFSVPFTYFSIIGVTNAINLMDGLNGLAGGAALISFAFLGSAALLNGNVEVAAVSFCFMGALAAFLRYNFPRARIFMGDSGSLFLGFSLAVLSIRLTQGEGGGINPMFPVLVLLIPIFDTLRVLAVRMMRGRNPFRADKSHLHHLFVRRGVPAVQAVTLLWGLTAFAGTAAFIMRRETTLVMLLAVFYGALGLILLAVVLAMRRKKRTARSPHEHSPVFLRPVQERVQHFLEAGVYHGRAKYR